MDKRHEEITLPLDMPPIHPPEHRLDVSLLRWSEVEKSLHRTRASSAPGPVFPLEAHEGGMT